MLQDFVNAIHGKNKLRITYFSKKDETTVVRLCAPMDVGPHKRFPDRGDYYHVWDYDGSSGPHPVPLSEEQIQHINILDEKFDPADFVTWDTDWTISRDWGSFS